ncbi:hypothetical protein A2U01_0057948, partial [Trifolium medium]|nr:hypothetical protein [Trifolium medium]
DDASSEELSSPQVMTVVSKVQEERDGGKKKELEVVCSI